MSRLIRLTLIFGALATCATSAGSTTLYNGAGALAPVDEALRPTISPGADIAQSAWDGFYVGVNAGGVWGMGSTADISTIATQLPVDPSISQVLTGTVPSNFGSFIGGGQAGYNYQWSNGLVTGVEVDLQGLTGGSSGHQAGAIADFYLPFITEGGVLAGSKQLDYLGTVRARVGYPVTRGVLAYATGGLAYGHASFSTGVFGVAFAPDGTVLASAASAASYSDTRVGWAAGVGVELMTLPNWSARVEYLYYDLGTATRLAPLSTTVPGFATPAVTQSTARYSGNIARVGVSYRFNNAALAVPVVAKY